jgi:Flp pilus assembly protein TadG
MIDVQRPTGLLTRLRRDRRGVSAVEFALLAPLMILFYFGVAEFCQGYMAQKRLGHTASAVGDLVAQTDIITKSQLDDVMGVGALIMKPFDTTALTTRISSVTRDDKGVAKVKWSRASGVLPRATDEVVTIPTGVIDNGQSLIMAETTYNYASPIHYLMPEVTKFSSVFYLRPRLVDAVPCTDCPKT